MKKIPQSVIDEFKKLEELFDYDKDKLIDVVFLVEYCKNNKEFENLAGFIESSSNTYLETLASDYFEQFMNDMTKDLPEGWKWKDVKGDSN